MIKVCTGTYVEVVYAGIECDRDYLDGKLVVRIVANGFDHKKTFEFPGMGGDFIQGTSPEVIMKELVPAKQKEIVEHLKEFYGFTDTQLRNILFDFNFTK